MTVDIDYSHLNAIDARLHRERSRLAASNTDAERELRTVWVLQAEREIAGERKFLGLPDSHVEAIEMTDDELLAALDV